MNLEMENELAYLLGWTDIVMFNDKLIGYPEGSNPKRQFRSDIPQYSRDIEENERLQKKYNININFDSAHNIYYGDTYSAKVSDYNDDAQKAKMCLVVLETLEALDGINVSYP